MEDKTTLVELTIETASLFEIIQEWAAETKFSVHETDDKRNTFSKNIRFSTAWLVVEHQNENVKINAWLAPKGMKPDATGNSWKGFKIAVPSGFATGPAAIYKKHFNKLMQMLGSKSNNISHTTTPANQTRIKRAGFAKGLAVLGVIIFLGGAISVMSAISINETSTFSDLAKVSLQKGIFDALLGAITFISSRLLKNGKVLAVWFYGSTIFLNTGYSIVMGYKFPYFSIFFGILIIMQLLELKKHGELA